MHKSASAGAGAIIKNWSAVRKCVQNKYQSVGVRAPHSKISSNPTDCNILCNKYLVTVAQLSNMYW